MSLYLTKTRRRLLDAVLDKEVTREHQDDYDANLYKVTSKMVELLRAGWVTFADGEWSLTDLGRAQLSGEADRG